MDIKPYSYNNVFRKIIDKEIPASIVYEDEWSLAFLDINPVEKGHTLVVPKTKIVTVLDLSEGDMQNIFWSVVTRVAKAVVETMSANGCNICTNVGAVAGQEIFHAHTHIIPRYKDKERTFTRGTYAKGEGEEIQKLIVSHIENV